MIARVAVRILLHEHASAPQFTTAFAPKEHMLGHLANVPDIVWRNGDKHTKEWNSPTHYLNLDQLIKDASSMPLPMTMAAAHDLAKQQKSDLSKLAGTAPWRIQQLGQMMRRDFVKAREAQHRKKPSDSGLDAAVDLALLHGGIMAHFVGDLSNPMHTVRDYDGFESGQGGVHAYFESELVNALDLTLDQEVYLAALQHPFETAQTQSAKRVTVQDKTLQVAWTLILNSFETRDALLKMDKDLAVLKPSQNDPIQFPAKRRSPADVAPKFRAMITSRLALAADALAELWYWSWQSAGQPDLSKYQSWKYPILPDFIDPDYLL